MGKTRNSKNARIPLTREIAFASGQTAIDIRMQKRTNKAWTAEDRADAASKTNSLLLWVPFSEGGLGGLTFTYAMMEDLGVTAEQVVRSGNSIAGHNGGPALEAAA